MQDLLRAVTVVAEGVLLKFCNSSEPQFFSDERYYGQVDAGFRPAGGGLPFGG